LPGLTRQSINLQKEILAKKMDNRVKPGDDECTLLLAKGRARAVLNHSFAVAA
jgi:hypothetical protein